MNKYSVGCQRPGLATYSVFMEGNIAICERYTNETLLYREPR